MTKLHSYLNFAGNAEEAFGFYKSGRDRDAHRRPGVGRLLRGV
jgi:hypothetical protein